MNAVEGLSPSTPQTGETEPLQALFSSLSEELREGLLKYWLSAGNILDGSGVRLHAPPDGHFCLERNFFSALFLYSYHRSRIARDRRVLYVAVNQCLRGMVTGCDNILDNEYKMTLDTDLPEGGTRFRSVMDIMVSDRVLVDLLLDYCADSGQSPDLIRKAGADSLRALTPSGVQEASEENAIQRRLPPEEVLSRIHHVKTGLLFQCVWAVPAIIEKDPVPLASSMKEALYRIGMGCQVLDDMVDLVSDMRMNRQNYIASLIFHEKDAEAWRQLTSISPSGSPGAFYQAYPHFATEALATASRFLEAGLNDLFLNEHRYLTPPSIAFIMDRIGAGQLLADIKGSRQF